MLRDNEKATLLMKKLLMAYASLSQVTASDADLAVHQFRKLLENTDFIQQLHEFSSQTSRLDILFHTFVANDFPELWQVIRKTLILSHGNASVSLFTQNILVAYI